MSHDYSITPRWPCVGGPHPSAKALYAPDLLLYVSLV